MQYSYPERRFMSPLIETFEEFSATAEPMPGRAPLFHEYEAGETVFGPSASPSSVFVLHEGLVRIYRLSETGAEIAFGYVIPGEIFGEATLFNDDARRSFAGAVRKSTVLVVPKEMGTKALLHRPSVALDVAAQLTKRLRRLENHLENSVVRDVRARVGLALIELADDFGQLKGDRLDIELPLTQAQIATLVGSTRQSVNTSLGELEEAGLIERRRLGVTVVQLEQLRHMCGCDKDT